MTIYIYKCNSCGGSCQQWAAANTDYRGVAVFLYLNFGTSSATWEIRMSGPYGCIPAAAVSHCGGYAIGANKLCFSNKPPGTYGSNYFWVYCW